ncbi:MAG: hypothetical protein ABI954_10390 [Pyrinomonadaceae bacterium]
MLTLKLKKYCLVLSLLFALLASPLAATACACSSLAASSHVNEHFQQPVAEDHCSPKAEAENHSLPSHDGQPVVQTAAMQDECCCAKNAPQRVILAEKKSEPAHFFQAAIVPAHFDFSIVWDSQPLNFFTPNIFYPARSRLSDKPARAPPIQ